MNTALIRVHRLLAAAMVAAALAGPLTHVAHAKPSTPDVPSIIAVPDGNKLFLIGHAVGVQIYSCDTTSNGFSWSFLAPRADLFDDRGKRIVTHFEGPTWQAKDGSRVVGQRVAGITVDDTAIPWLLLSASSTDLGPSGDRLAGTTYIQRIATSGGLPPAAEDCNADTMGSKAEVAYTSDYAFWK